MNNQSDERIMSNFQQWAYSVFFCPILLKGAAARCRGHIEYLRSDRRRLKSDGSTLKVL